MNHFEMLVFAVYYFFRAPFVFKKETCDLGHILVGLHFVRFSRPTLLLRLKPTQYTPYHCIYDLLIICLRNAKCARSMLMSGCPMTLLAGHLLPDEVW